MARVVICLDIDGTDEDALAVVDALLDNGVPQDAINDHEVEDCGPLHVRSAIVRLADIVPVSRHSELFETAEAV